MVVKYVITDATRRYRGYPVPKVGKSDLTGDTGCLLNIMRDSVLIVEQPPWSGPGGIIMVPTEDETGVENEIETDIESEEL